MDYNSIWEYMYLVITDCNSGNNVVLTENFIRMQNIKICLFISCRARTVIEKRR